VSIHVPVPAPLPAPDPSVRVLGLADAASAGTPDAIAVHSCAVAEPVATHKAPAETRWRTFADVVAFTLGINVWLTIVILPAAFVGVLGQKSVIAAALAPLAALIAGLVRRSELVLLGLFPAAVLLPISLAPQLASSHVYGPVRFALVALGVVAYLFGVSFFTTFHEPPAPRSIRPLSSAQYAPAPRWQRRERMYWMLAILAVMFPALLIAWVNFDDTIAAYLGEMYPGRVALMTTALTAGAIVLWLGIYHYAFLGALRPHRTGDRDLVVELARARADAKTGKPRGRFYVAVGAALAAMILLVLLRNL
jgi:hypothetical protein